ncbi:hypothetical protein ACNHKD_07890 [Methylocystis sp. JAN1]|uniref:hypothetical protein n=1 Tax=Methylocystis sp. JAN1 TaxID=3397211 RepID=UPI003FA30B2B
MYLVLSIPFFTAFFLAWNRVRGFLAPGAHLDFRPLFPRDPLYALAIWLDAQKVAEIQFVAYTLVAGLFLAALGFFCDVLLRGKGFGASGNASLLLTGILFAAWAWSVWAPYPYQSGVAPMVFAAAFGGGLVLLMAVELKHVIVAKLDELGSGALAASPRKPRPRTAQDVIGRRVGRASCANFTQRR